MDQQSPAETQAQRIEEGQNAPDFTLTDQDGQLVTLSNLQGKNVLVYFYPKDDTPGCTKEACSLRDTWQDFVNTDTVILGISRDDAVSHRRFIEKYRLPFTLLSDPNAEVMARYGAWGEKNMYGKKSMGVIRSSFLIGPSGHIKKVWRRVKTETHGTDVLAAL
jgi:peroxiredoxin Q/BCP